MFEDFIERDNRSLRENVLYPPKSWFKEKTYSGWDRSNRETKIKNCEGKLVVTHNDLDGLVSGALFQDYYGDEITIVPVDYDGIEHIFNKIDQNIKDIEEIFVSDLNIDEVYDCLDGIENNVEAIHWLDHHEWGEEADEFRRMGINLIINQDNCGARIVFNYLKKQGYEYNGKVESIVDLTEDRDLWLKEAETVEVAGEEQLLSDVLSDFSFFADDEEFMSEIFDYGKEFINYPDKIMRDGYGEGFIAEKIEEERQKMDYLENNYFNIEEVSGITVGFLYGRTSPGDFFDRVKEKYQVDMLVLTRPKGKISIRSVDDLEICHHVAERLGGGGHPCAAGCFPDHVDSLHECMTHWQQKGQPLMNTVQQKIEKAVEEDMDKPIKTTPAT